MTTENAPGAVTAKPSATIIVLRETSGAPEVLLVKRRAGDAFGESYTFPGGVVDSNEAHALRFGSGIDPTAANETLGIDSGGLEYYSAGIRELFEETGILLARTVAGDWADCGAEIAPWRADIDRGRRAWADFLQQFEFAMAFDALHYFAHWITPLIRPKRWTTRFFLAELPAGQIACHDGYETTDSLWIDAQAALRDMQRGVLKIPYPTLKTLESLQDISTTAEIPQWARAKQNSGIDPVRPDHVANREP